MSLQKADPFEIGSLLRRTIGAYGTAGSGPLLMAVAGIHGNECAGVIAARRVIDALEERKPAVKGRFVAFTGNLQALEADRRFIDHDLNRLWTETAVSSLSPGEGGGRDTLGSEAREMCELLESIRNELARLEVPAIFLDLHTNSAGGAPFVCIGDTLRNRSFALKLGLPVVLGLEEQIDGALLEYVNNRGHVTVGVEGGQHRDPASIEHHESLVWMALIAAGILEPSDVPDLTGHRERLKKSSEGIPAVVEVRRHHMIREDDEFQMEEGFANFHPVGSGQSIANDRGGSIRASENGRILLPLYQSQGDDGFFTVREVSSLWLEVSRFLRRLRVSRFATWLPGVSRHPESDETFVVNTRVARYFPLQIFHLLGFRKRRWHGNVLLVSRRRHDVPPGS